MTVPLMVLAFCSIFAGYLGVSRSIARIVGIHGETNRFEAFLAPVFENAAEKSAEANVAHEGTVPAKPEGKEESSAAEYLLMVLSVAAAGAGWWAARRAYNKDSEVVRDPIAVAAPAVYNTLLHKYYVDEFYDVAFTGRAEVAGVRLGAIGSGEALWKFDADVIDGGVNGAGWATKFSGRLSSWWDKWIIDGIGVNGPAFVTGALAYPVKWFQWGLLQWYALVMVVGVAGLLWYYVLR